MPPQKFKDEGGRMKDENDFIHRSSFTLYPSCGIIPHSHLRAKILIL
jgi:hypothetical protein